MRAYASVRPVEGAWCAGKGIVYVNTKVLDNAFDVRYQRDPSTGEGTLVYTTRIDIGGLVGGLESLFFNFEGKHYEFFDIELMGWKRHRKGLASYTYYIVFKRMRQVPMHVFTREREVSAGAVE